MIESNQKHLDTWREDVKLAAVRALEDHPGWERDYAAVTAHVTFTLPRPKAHYRTGKHADELRPDAPTLHASKPDLDKLLRSTGDALTAAGVYRDDSRLAQVFAVKVYTANGGGVPGALDVPGAKIVLTGTTR
jgi:crossover junction endodeoxyribonuclease RusA